MNGTAIRLYCFVRAAFLAACAPALAGCFYEEYEVTDAASVAGGCVKSGAKEPIACKQDMPTAIAVDSMNVYWTNEGSGEIMAMSKADGTVAPLVTGEDRPCGIAAAKQDFTDYIFWRTHGGDLKKMGVVSKVIEVMKSQLGDSCLIGADIDDVFYFRRPAVQVNELMQKGSKGEVTITTTQRPSYLSVGSGARIAFVDAVEKKAYLTSKTSGAAKEDLGINEPCGIALQLGFGAVTSMSRGEVSAFDLAQGFAAKATITGQSSPCLVETTKDGLYWLSDSDGSLLFRALTVQGAPTLIATGPAHACAITTDDKYVYWTSCDSEGMVLRAPK